MKTLNLNIENWSMLDPKSDRDYQKESPLPADDIVSSADYISQTNIDEPLCDMAERDYIH